MVAVQNSMVALSAAAALALLWGSLRQGPAFYALMGVAMGAGAASSLGSMGSTLSVEREWTKTLCAGDFEALAQLNAGKQGLRGQALGQQRMAACLLRAIITGDLRVPVHSMASLPPPFQA